MTERDYKTIVLPPKYQPKKSEKYMCAEQKAYFYRRLIERKEELKLKINESVDDINLGKRMETGGAMDDGDTATLSMDADLSIAIRERDMGSLRKIDLALESLENGTYGYSILSGDEIGIKRLMVRPLATLTVEEREEKEREEANRERRL
jgi:DnaK suppressor protein